MREVIVPRKQFKVVIECRPTTPDVEVNLMLVRIYKLNANDIIIICIPIKFKKFGSYRNANKLT